MRRDGYRGPVISKTNALRLVAAVGVTGVLVGGGAFTAWSGTEVPEEQASLNVSQWSSPAASASPRATGTSTAAADDTVGSDVKAKAEAEERQRAERTKARRLAAAAEQQADAAAAQRKQRRQARVAAAAEQPLSFDMMSFNILGSQHTAPGGGTDNYAPGRIRSEWAANVMNDHDASIVGFQEIQRDQLDSIMAATQNRYAVYPGDTLGGKGIPQSVMWRTDVWESTWQGYFDIPFTEQVRPQPYVRLRNLATGREIYVINMHTSAKTTRHPREADRDKATATVITLIHQLQEQEGLPIFLTGDMNEHAEIFCKITGQTDLVAAAGGSNANGSCRPPRGMRVDWIFGNGTFSGYVQDRSPMVANTTDHAVIATHVDVP